MMHFDPNNQRELDTLVGMILGFGFVCVLQFWWFGIIKPELRAWRRYRKDGGVMEPKNWPTLEEAKRFGLNWPPGVTETVKVTSAAQWAVETLPKLHKVIAAMRAHAEDAAWHPSYRNALAKFLPDLAALLPKEE